ncbi:P-selectin-like isoform 2-T2 [Anomaloglossus baeobatrachus]|uniref:P-selectin-like isoform X2 n=1 Tax=Anomaloglossus baeobatrachus TaxID=238106 RepID=UPI003F50877E
MDTIPFQAVGSNIAGKWSYLQLLCLAILSFGFLRVVEVSGWTYHYSTTVQTWSESHNWCRVNFTDMVAIQNKEEISFLLLNLPNDSTHYWIGLRKKNKIWFWIGTNKTLTKNEENWAENEPNNIRNNQDCVEIYIRRSKESGKWNDERCDKKKRALCYLVSCKDLSCNKHGDCMETVENYTCNCWPGFHGANCKNAVSCRFLHSPSNGKMVCSDIYGTFQYNSECKFSCEDGFNLIGSSSSSCQSSGEWSESTPTCKAVQCTALQSSEHGAILCTHIYGENRYKSICNITCEEGFEFQGTSSLLCEKTGEWSESTPSCIAVQCTTLQSPEHGTILCTHIYGENRYKSICNMTCEEGFELQGTSSLLCEKTGEWSESTPSCIAVQCTALQSPEHGTILCTHIYGENRYKSICNITCEEGFELQGTSSLLCEKTGEWSESTPSCIAQNVSMGNQKQIHTVAYSLSSVGLMLSGLPMAYGINYYCKKKNAGLLKEDKDKKNTFENPAFEDNDI